MKDVIVRKQFNFGKNLILNKKKKQRQEKYRKIINSIYKDNYMKKEITKSIILKILLIHMMIHLL